MGSFKDSFVAFDLETDKLAPEEWNGARNNLKRKRDAEDGPLRCDLAMMQPTLNITCAATRRVLAGGTEEALVWTTPTAESGMTCPLTESEYSELQTHTVEEVVEGSVEDSEGASRPLLCEPYMKAEDVRAMALYLEKCVYEDGCVISTFNGLSFDFQVVHEILEAAGRRCIASASSALQAEQAAEEYMEVAKRFKLLAQSEHHFDIAFSFFVQRGFMISLSKACLGTLGESYKKFEISGADAPALFTKSRLWQNTVLKYCAQDVNLQAALQRRLYETRQLKWVTKKGGVASWWVPTKNVHVHLDEDEDEDADGKCAEQVVQMVKSLNLGVEYSLTRPEPDTSWMEKYGMVAWPRAKFTAWLGASTPPS